jgi:predicted dinucleotide-binding enzyme
MERTLEVTIIGSGNVARGIGSRMLAGGHDLIVIGKDLESAEAVAADIGGAGIVMSAVTGDPIDGEVVVLAVYYPDARVAAEPSADELAGKVLVDITSRVNETFNGLVVTPDGPTTAEVAALVGGARFVKAFDTTFATTLMAGEVAGHKLDVLIAGDDEDAKGKVGAGARRRAQPDRRRLAETSARARGGRPASRRTPEHARNRLRSALIIVASP